MTTESEASLKTRCVLFCVMGLASEFGRFKGPDITFFFISLASRDWGSKVDEIVDPTMLFSWQSNGAGQKEGWEACAGCPKNAEEVDGRCQCHSMEFA